MLGRSAYLWSVTVVFVLYLLNPLFLTQHQGHDYQSSMSAQNQLSVIVPTYNEPPNNIRRLCERLFAAAEKQVPKLEVQLLIVDDESKGSAALATQVAELAKNGYKIGLLARKKSEGRGLSSAVMLGLRKAEHGVMVVMDADLQHEPESVPAVAAPVLQGKAQFSVGSRNVAGGKVAGWTFSRKLISQVATMLAMPVTTCRDPMSGFFCLSKTTLAQAKNVNDVGFKIGLELQVRSNAKTIAEVPITFQDREEGESKLTMKQNIEYVSQLLALYWYKYGVLVLLPPILVLAFLYYFILPLIL